MARAGGTRNVVSENQFHFAEYNWTTNVIEFNYQDIVSRVKQSHDYFYPNPTIVFATAIGQPKSGKSTALNKLAAQWNPVGTCTSDFQVPRQTHGDFQGIKLRFFDVPMYLGSYERGYLICLDVVCDPGWQYEQLMQVCYNMSNLIIFTFSKGSHQELMNLQTGGKEGFRAAAYLNGYGPFTSEPRYYNDSQDLDLSDFGEDAEAIQKAMWSIAKVISKFPVQTEHASPKINSNTSSGATSGYSQTPPKNIFSSLLYLLSEEQFKKALQRSSNLEKYLVEIMKNFPTRAQSVNKGPKQSWVENTREGGFADSNLTVRQDFKPKSEAGKKFDNFVSSSRSFTTEPKETGGAYTYRAALNKNSSSIHRSGLPNKPELNVTTLTLNQAISKPPEETRNPKDDYSNSKASSSRFLDSSANYQRNYNVGWSTSGDYQKQQYQRPQLHKFKSPETSKVKPVVQNQLPASKPPATSFCEPILSKDTAKTRLMASFRQLSLLLVTSATNFQSSNSSGSDVMKKWEVLIESMNLKSFELKNAANQLGNSLKCLQDFFTSFFDHSVDKYFETSTHVASNQLELLRVDLYGKLEIQLANITVERDYCSKLCNAYLNTVFSAISRKIEANRTVDELLAENICKAAFDSYIDQIDQLLQDNIFNDKEVKVHHKKIVGAILSSFTPEQMKVWGQRIGSLADKMNSNGHDVMNRNRRNLSQLRKMISSSLRTWQQDFDRLFSNSSTTMDIELYFESKLTEALKQASTDKQLQAATKEVKQMMAVYAAA